MGTPFPDADPVIAACRAAVAVSHGADTVLTATPTEALTDSGIRVEFKGRGARRRALAGLPSFGYVAHAHDPGDALIVTGWDNEVLAAHAALLEQAANELLHQYPPAASIAPGAYRYCVDTLGYSADRAEHTLADSFSLRVTNRPDDVAHRCRRNYRRHPDPAGDIRLAPDHTRALLVRIAAADAKLQNLVMIYTGTVRGVRRLFDGYRRTRRDDSADAVAAAVVRDVAAATASCASIATADLDPPGSRAGLDADDDNKAALEAHLFDAEGAPHLHVAERLTIMRITNQGSLDKVELCRRCHVELLFVGRYEPHPWLDSWGDHTCSDGRPHQLVPGAYQPLTG